MNKIYLYFIFLFFSHVSCSYDMTDDVIIHGFFTQNAIHTSANNMYGDSENAISTDYTEAGLNIFYTPFDFLNFSFQGLYRNAGKVDVDSFDFDYGFVDIRIQEYQDGDYGFRLGRIKNPLGLYNETRDVAFTTPSIILPQGIYRDASRDMLRFLDGAQFHLNHRISDDDFLLKLNYGRSRNDNDEILRNAIPYPTPVIPIYPEGKLKPSMSNPSILGQLVYEQNGGEFVYSLSYADVSLEYNPIENDPFLAGTTDFTLYVLSTQYNGEKFSLTAEYLYQNNDISGFGTAFPDIYSTSESWYLQLAYRYSYNWQVYTRYDEMFVNNDNRTGKNNDLFHMVRHRSFSKDIMFGIRWDVNSSVLLRAEYHNMNGTSWLTSADNPEASKTHRYWDIFALQLSLKF